MAKDLTKVQKIVFICNGDSCTSFGADENTLELRAKLKEHLLWDDVHTVRTKCMGQCKQGPIVFIHPEGLWYKTVSPHISREIVTTHLLQNTLLKDHILHPVEETKTLDPVTKKRLTFKRMINQVMNRVSQTRKTNYTE